FWRSVLGDERVDSMGIRHILFDLGKNLGLGTSGRQTTQLLLCFGVIVTLLIAWRSVKARRSSLSYGLRVGINIAFIIGAFLLAVWRIQADKVAVITPTLEILGLNHQSPIDASRGAAFLLAIILSGVAIFGNRDASRFDSIFVGISGAS